MRSEAAARADFSTIRYAQVWEDADVAGMVAEWLHANFGTAEEPRTQAPARRSVSSYAEPAPERHIGAPIAELAAHTVDHRGVMGLAVGVDPADHDAGCRTCHAGHALPPPFGPVRYGTPRSGRWTRQ